MPELTLEAWTCGDPQDDCNAIVLSINGTELAHLPDLLNPYSKEDQKESDELGNVLIQLGFPERDSSENLADFWDWEGVGVEITDEQVQQLIQFLKDLGHHVEPLVKEVESRKGNNWVTTSRVTIETINLDGSRTIVTNVEGFNVGDWY